MAKVTTAEEIALEISKLSTQSNSQFLGMIKKGEKTIKDIYKKASARIGRLIKNSQGDIKELKAIQNELLSRIRELNDRSTALFNRLMNRSVNLGVKATAEQINIFKNMLPSDIVASEIVASVFKSTSERAILALGNSFDGIELSSKIWNINKISLSRMRRYIADSMLAGIDSRTIFAKVKSFLLLPNTDMRTKAWKKFFKLNPPGRGVYKSAYKNLLRVIRTETTRAYRIGMQTYASGRPWIKGIQWVLSDAHPQIDICDEIAVFDGWGLGAGVYPPDQVPFAGHPNCICHTQIVPNYDYMDLSPVENIGTVGAGVAVTKNVITPSPEEII